MRGDTQQLIPVNKHRFENEPVRQCYLTKLFQFCEVRNVWGPQSFPWGGRAPNPQSVYPGDMSFCLDLASAQARVEKHRTKGSKWVIHERPVVSIGGLYTCLVVGEINSLNPPLSGFVPLKRKLLTLRECANFFRPRSPDSVFLFVCVDCPNPATLPFYRHESESRGGGQPLRWNREFGLDDLAAALQIVCHISESVQQHGQNSFLAAAAGRLG